MTQNVAGKTVVVTGASSGIGEAVAKRLAANGANLVLGARRTDRIEALAEELRKGGAQAVTVTTDVARRDQVEALVARAIEKFGRVDVMVNNAGLMPLSLLEKLRVGEWEQMIDVNLKGMLYGIAAVLPHMIAQKGGHVINIASTAGHRVGPTTAVYSATKHAVRVVTEGLRQEMTPHNVRATIISPGAIATELLDGIHDVDAADALKNVPLFALQPDTIARAVLFAIEQPEDVDVNEILVRPTRQER